ncbi:glycine zipper domain-containing protein [Verrucomicrobiaceae bacterium 227]
MSNKIKKLIVLPASIAALSLGASCGNYNSAAKNDAATGALLGGAAGAIIGNQSGNAGKGAALGAAVGGAGGYAVGNEKDKRRY